MKPLFFMSIFCTLLYFFPKIVLSLLGLLVLWMLWPLLMQLRVIIVKFIEAPYGEGTMPEKVKNSEEAVEIAQGSGKSHYEVLNAHRGASPDEIKKSYRKMSLLLHPDKNPDPAAAQALIKVNEAYEVLKDPYRRAEYDAEVDNGEAAGWDENYNADEPIQPPEGMPQGPPGLKKRRKPPGARRKS
jgi:hypothetical protein